MLDLQELQILESLINTTFGRASMRDAGHAIAHKVMNHCDDGCTLEIRFESIVNVNSRAGIATAQKEFDDVSRKAIDEQIKQIKSDFKTESGRSLKVKEFKSDRPGQQPLRESFLEIISFNPSLLRGKYYRTIQYHIE